MSTEHFGLNIITSSSGKKRSRREAVKIVYNRIRDLREDADLTQNDISAYLHISQRAYSHYENGSRDIPTDILIKLADYYDVSVDYLLNRTDNKKTAQKKTNT